REVKYSKKIRTFEFYNESNNECIEILKKKLEALKEEKEGVDGKLAGLLKASKDLDNLSESQSTSGDDQNKNSSASENGESTDSILSKLAVKFVKAIERSTTNKVETVKKPSLRYAELYRKPSKKSTVRGNQQNWNNLKSQQLGNNFVMKKKACYNCGHFDHLSYNCGLGVKIGRSSPKNNYTHIRTKLEDAVRTKRSRGVVDYILQVKKKVRAYYSQLMYHQHILGDQSRINPSWEIGRVEQEEEEQHDDIEGYKNRFHELALMYLYLVTPKKKKIEHYIRGLLERVNANVTSSKPTSLHDAINMAWELVEQLNQAKAQNRRQEAKKAYVAAPAEGRGYVGNLSLCNRFKVHYHGQCPPRCGRCHKRRWIELFSDYDCEIRYHSSKENVVADALSKKERLKLRRVRAMSMTIYSGLKTKILEEQVKASKDLKALAESLRGLDAKFERQDDGEIYFVDQRSHRLEMKRKLAPRYVGPFEIVKRMSPVVYHLRLPQELSSIHDTFHVLNLKKCLADASLQVPLEEIEIDEKLHFVEEPVKIVDREVKKLKQKRIPIIKDRWNSKRGVEFTWEREYQFKTKYPHLFVTNSSVIVTR
nr:reverse transcriptase domain-containing protein [Tanacetum cinerariifolium]